MKLTISTLSLLLLGPALVASKKTKPQRALLQKVANLKKNLVASYEKKNAEKLHDHHQRSLAEFNCLDWDGWTDSTGDDCSWYVTPVPGMEEEMADETMMMNSDNNVTMTHGDDYSLSENCFGHSFFAAEDNTTAADACCACGGGNCMDLGGWTDSDGYNCTYYAENDLCDISDSWANADGLTAMDACCACRPTPDDVVDDNIPCTLEQEVAETCIVDNNCQAPCEEVFDDDGTDDDFEDDSNPLDGVDPSDPEAMKAAVQEFWASTCDANKGELCKIEQCCSACVEEITATLTCINNFTVSVLETQITNLVDGVSGILDGALGFINNITSEALNETIAPTGTLDAYAEIFSDLSCDLTDLTCDEMSGPDAGEGDPDMPMP